MARRQEDFRFRVETSRRVRPVTYQQVAGLTHYYNRFKFHFLAVTWHETLGRVLTIMSCPGDCPDGRLTFPLAEPIALPGTGPVASRRRGRRRRSCSSSTTPASGWQRVGPVLDASVISDEGGRGAHGSFTGAFVGMLAFDTTGAARPADFSHFSYAPR